jgi:hypothetical protein
VEVVVTFLACWIVGAALTYWLAERELPAQCRPGLRREIASIVIVAWPCALAVYVLSLLGIIGDDEEGDA